MREYRKILGSVPKSLNLSEQSKKRFHCLKYIEKVADISADALSDTIGSGGSTNDISATAYNVADLYSLVKTYDFEINCEYLSISRGVRLCRLTLPFQLFDIRLEDTIQDEGLGENDQAKA